MEIHFQNQQKPKSPSKTKPRKNTKFIGVRQRPSGRWVAEIKDTTHKIRMWLGTFQTAEEAACAYDQAACLLRGSNTRTNFVTQVPSNSPLASRIRSLLNSTKASDATKPKKQSPSESQSHSQELTPSQSTSTSQEVECSTTSCTTSHSTSQVFDDVYKPDMSSCINELHECSSTRSGIGPWGFDQLMDLPKSSSLSLSSSLEMELPEFERYKVERQISASLYAMNGLNEYMETVFDSNEAFWDLPPLCPLLS